MISSYGAVSQTSPPYSPKVLIPYNLNGAWGYADTFGTVIYKPQYDSVGFFEVWHNSHALVKRHGKTGIVDNNYDLVVKCTYDYLKGTNCCPKEDINFFSVGNGKKWGVYASSGKKVIPIKYDDIDFNFLVFGLIAVSKNKKYAMFTLDGKRITDFKFNLFAPGIFAGGGVMDLLAEADDGNYLIKSDKTVVPAPEQPNSISVDLSDPNSRDTKKLPDEKRQFYLKRSNEIKAQHMLDTVFLERPLNRAGFKGDYQYVLVEKDGKKGVWDLKKNTVKFNDYEDILTIRTYNKQIAQKYGFSELWYGKKNGKWGIATEAGGTHIPFEYDGFGEITDSFAETKANGKSGAVLLFTHYAPIPCKYDSIDFLQQIEVTNQWAFGVYKVTYLGYTGYVGENGVEFFKFN